MPNWCQNKLSVFNPTPELIDYLSKEGFSFEKIVPPNRPESDESGFPTCSAQVDAWGTKWDLNEQESEEVAYQLAKFPESEFHLAFYESGCWLWSIEYYSGENFSSDECGSGGTNKEAAEFLVEYMGYDEEDANECAGVEEDDEEE